MVKVYIVTIGGLRWRVNHNLVTQIWVTVKYQWRPITIFQDRQIECAEFSVNLQVMMAIDE